MTDLPTDSVELRWYLLQHYETNLKSGICKGLKALKVPSPNQIELLESSIDLAVEQLLAKATALHRASCVEAFVESVAFFVGKRVGRAYHKSLRPTSGVDASVTEETLYHQHQGRKVPPGFTKDSVREHINALKREGVIEGEASRILKETLLEGRLEENVAKRVGATVLEVRQSIAHCIPLLRKHLVRSFSQLEARDEDL